MSVMGSLSTAVANNAIVMGPWDTDNSNSYGLPSNQLTLQVDNLGGGLVVEQSNDNITWYSLQTLSATGIISVSVNTKYVRVRATASGSPVISGRLSNSSSPPSSGSPVAVSDGANASQGAKSDAMATSGVGSWSMISLLKGLLDALLGAILPVFTSVQASNLVIKNSPGSLYEVSITSQATAGYLMVFDAVAIPANGTVTPKIVIPLGTNTAITKSYNKPMQFSTGIVAAFSSTGPFTLTASATAFLSGMVK